MKKLLALILCVMLFVSVIPTMAFAADPDPKAVAAAQANLEAATKAYNDAYANSVKTWKAKNTANAEVTAIKGKLEDAKDEYETALNNYVGDPTDPDLKLALDEAAAKRDSLQADYDAAKVAATAAAAAYDADLKAEKIATAELNVAAAELTYAHAPTADNKALIAVAEADLAALIPAPEVVPVYTKDDVKAAITAALKAKDDTVKAIAAAYDADYKAAAEAAQAAQYGFAMNIVDNYDDLVDAYVFSAGATAAKELTKVEESVAKHYADLQKSADEAADKIVADLMEALA